MMQKCKRCVKKFSSWRASKIWRDRDSGSRSEAPPQGFAGSQQECGRCEISRETSVPRVSEARSNLLSSRRSTMTRLWREIQQLFRRRSTQTSEERRKRKSSNAVCGNTKRGKESEIRTCTTLNKGTTSRKTEFKSSKKQPESGHNKSSFMFNVVQKDRRAPPRLLRDTDKVCILRDELNMQLNVISFGGIRATVPFVAQFWQKCDYVKQDGEPVLLGMGYYGKVYLVQVGDQLLAMKTFMTGKGSLISKIITEASHILEANQIVVGPKFHGLLPIDGGSEYMPWAILMEFFGDAKRRRGDQFWEILQVQRKLRRKKQAGPLTNTNCIKIMLDICEQVCLLNSRGMVHKGVTLSNIVVTEEDGTCQGHLVDFGQSCHIEKGTRDLEDLLAIKSCMQVIDQNLRQNLFSDVIGLITNGCDHFECGKCLQNKLREKSD